MKKIMLCAIALLAIGKGQMEASAPKREIVYAKAEGVYRWSDTMKPLTTDEMHQHLTPAQIAQTQKPSVMQAIEQASSGLV